MASSTVGLILSAKYVNIIKIINGIKISYVYIFIMLFLLFTIYYTGQQHYAGIDHVLIAIGLIPIGLLIRKTDPTPLVIGYLLHEPLFDGWFRMVDLYF